MKKNRRKFIKNSLGLLSTAAISQNIFASELLKNNLEIAIQMYSFGPEIMQGKFNILDFPKFIRDKFQVKGAEYWSIPFMGNENDECFKNIKRKKYRFKH